jgi:hypothetical protein
MAVLSGNLSGTRIRPGPHLPMNEFIAMSWHPPDVM